MSPATTVEVTRKVAMSIEGIRAACREYLARRNIHIAPGEGDVAVYGPCGERSEFVYTTIEDRYVG